MTPPAFGLTFLPAFPSPFPGAFGGIPPTIEQKNYDADDEIPCARIISCSGYVKEDDV